ncbi:MAG: lysophospholipid acyltransferase family protein [Planctomycetota bacterium]
MHPARVQPALSMRQHLTHQALYNMLRAGLSLPHLMRPTTAVHAARIIGRTYGGLPLNRARVNAAAERIATALPGVPREQRRELVIQSYEHLAMLASELTIAPRIITDDKWPDVIELGSITDAMRPLMSGRPLMLLTGHCGNWEILGYTLAMLGYRMHVLYRPLDLRPADKWVRASRSRRGLMLLDKFGASHALPGLIESGESVGFVADQNAGDRGLQVPYFNRLASSYKSIALMATRFQTPILVGQARRLQPSPDHPAGVRYRIELADSFGPEDWEHQPDPMFYITARYRRAIEKMVRAAPEQYLWMHRIWKSRPRHERLNNPFPDRLKDKLRELPWMTEGEIAQLVEQSDRDRAHLRETGKAQLT